MTTQAKAPAESPTVVAVVPERRRFTVAEYYRMAEAGILGPDERIELIEGEIVVVPPIGPGHAWNVTLSNRAFSLQSDDRFIVQIQNPIRLADGSEPQPALALLRNRPEGYGTSHPVPADVLLVIEVADSGLEYDREVKAHLYGRAGVPETWVQNLPDGCIERFTQPSPDGYGQHIIHHRGEKLNPVSLPGLELAVDDLLPPAPAADAE